MRVLTLNCNGIRAAAKKGLFDWLPEQQADVVCLQETKAQIHQLEDPMFHPEGYECHYFDAEKKGYSGTALYCKKQPDKVSRGLGFEVADSEGRYIQADYGELSIASIYLPSGSSGDEKQIRKFDFMDKYMKLMRKQMKTGRDYIICGDWNICHKEIDLRNWKPNQKNSGFLPEERAWLDTLYDEVGYVDAFRQLRPEPDLYSWWSNRGQARAKNVGWRLDYHVVTANIAAKAKSAEIFTDIRFSDHAPVIMDYEIDL